MVASAAAGGEPCTRMLGGSAMSTHAINALAFALALAASLGLGALGHRAADDVGGIRDAAGAAIAPRPWRRVASASLIGDAALAELAGAERVVAISAWSGDRHAACFPGAPRLRGFEDLETLLALRPELLLVSAAGAEPERRRRLEDAGIAVFDLGEARGAASYAQALRDVASLLGEPERGAAAAERFLAELATVAAGAPPEAQRPRALFLMPIGDGLVGGTVGTSFHDVLGAAGMRDAAALRWRDWPVLGTEDVLVLDPDLIVCPTGSAERLRRRPGFDRLRACRDPRGVVELPSELLEDPGPGIVAAARRLRALVRSP